MGIEPGLAKKVFETALSRAGKAANEPGREKPTPAPAEATRALAEEIVEQAAQLGTRA